MKKIAIIHRDKIEYIAIDKLKKSDVGQKTMGLISIPSLWTPDFFVVSSDLVSSYKNSCNNNKRNIISEYVAQIKKQMIFSHFEEKIILRSSASEESMEERGKYDSIKSNALTLNADLEKLVNKLIESCDKNVDIAIIVQQFIDSNKSGHMSNERRFYKDARDWKVELYIGEEFFDNQICIRKWRKTYDLEKIRNSKLKCSSRGPIEELRKVAYYWYNMSKITKFRYHLEFVYTNETIYIVQADFDNSIKDTKNPTNYNVKISHNVLSQDLRILKIYNYQETKYKKLLNPKIYNDLNLPTVKFYFLDDENTIQNLYNGIVSIELEQDIKSLLNIQSIVIRTDIIHDNKAEGQMLPRSTELKDYKSVKEWLLENVKEIYSRQGIFIFHNFIPSIASAFAHAKPNGTRVEIQSLWGLPEGLYYNAHDTAVVKFPYADMDKVNKENIYVTNKIHYKDSFVYPEPSGRWSVGKIAEPFDWKCSIQEPESIYDIAIQSQKIANYYKEEISVMWFVGIDEKYYGANNIPWFHEKIEIDSYTTDSYKRKYFKDEEYILTNKDDLENLKLDNAKIKCVRIKPNDEEILRNKDFLSKVGAIVAEKNLSILLEGAQLTHSYYQLRRTGANVVCTNPNEFNISNDMEFNKLVRDLIPEKIVAGGEVIKCGIASEILYDRLLLEKLLEEAYEVMDSSDEYELKEELADMLEVLDAIREKTGNSKLSCFDFNERTIPTNDTPFFIKHLGLQKIQSYQFKFEDFYCMLHITRQKTAYRFELNISNINEFGSKHISQDSIWLLKRKSKIVKISSILLLDNTKQKNVKLLSQLETSIKEICQSIPIDYDDIQKEKKDKNEKRGGFKEGYVLLNTSLTESYAESDIFNPKDCGVLTSISKSVNKYIDLRKNDENKQNVLIIRFNVPIAINNWGISIESKKVKEFFNVFDTVDFKLKKQNNGKIKLQIAVKNNNVEQITLFDI